MLNNFQIRGWTPGSSYAKYSCMWKFHCLQNDILTWPTALLQLAKQHGLEVVDRIRSFFCGFQERTPLAYELDQDTISQSTHNTYIHLHILQIHWSYVMRGLCNAMFMYWWSSEKFHYKDKHLYIIPYNLFWHWFHNIS